MRRQDLNSENFSQEDRAIDVALRVVATGSVFLVLAGLALKIIFF